MFYSLQKSRLLFHFHGFYYRLYFVFSCIFQLFVNYNSLNILRKFKGCICILNKVDSSIHLYFSLKFSKDHRTDQVLRWFFELDVTWYVLQISVMVFRFCKPVDGFLKNWKIVILIVELIRFLYEFSFLLNVTFIFNLNKKNPLKNRIFFMEQICKNLAKKGHINVN